MEEMRTICSMVRSGELKAKQLKLEELEKALDEEGHPPCELVPASEPIMKLRQTKDPEELAAMEAAQGIAERALEDILTVSVDCFRSDDPAAAKKVEPLEETIDRLTDEIRARHIHRLQSGECTVQLGFILNDLLTNLERVSDHCSNIAVCVIEEREDHGEQRHAYLHDFKAAGEFTESLDKDLRKYKLP